jgi:hypothetical protein
MARAESLTDDGAWPSAQLIVVSALAFVAAVRDQDHKVISCYPLKTGWLNAALNFDKSIGLRGGTNIGGADI